MNLEELKIEREIFQKKLTKLNKEISVIESKIKQEEYDKAKALEIKLTIVKSLSELKKAIEERYMQTGMKLDLPKCNYCNNVLYIEFGVWSWKGKKKFIGKQYFKTTEFTSGDIDGYHDPELFLIEILGVTGNDFGTGGIASNWYRSIKNVKDFVFNIPYTERLQNYQRKY